MPALSLEAVWLSCDRNGRKFALLRDIAMKVGEGELVVVYGKRGSGKTALLRLIAGATPPSAGVVRLGGRPVMAGEKRIRWVDPEAPPLTGLPAAIHVSLPLVPELGHRAAQRVAVDALVTVGAGECSDRAWADLSGQERPLVALAHALVQRPSVLLIDDVARALGAVEKSHLISLLCGLAEDRRLAVVLTTADLETMASAPSVRYLVDGRLLHPDAAARASTP